AGVGRTWILARAEDVEVAEADVLQSIHTAERLRVEFADVFGDAVGRNRLRLHRFDFRQSRRFAVSGRGSGEDDAFDFGVARGEQNVQSAFDVDAIGFEGVFDGAGNRSARGKVDDVIGFVHRAADGFDIVDGAFDEGNLVARFGE